jgi:hypothetical protein
MPNINVNISDFDELVNQEFPIDAKYVPLGTSILDTHAFGSDILKTLNALGEYNVDNVFNLEVVDGIPSAVYGFTLALDKDLKPSLFFGCNKGGESNPPNKLAVTVQVETDEDDDEFVLIRVGKAQIDFDYNAQTKRISAWLVYKKTRISINARFVKGVEYAQVDAIASADDLTKCLDKLGSGSYSYKLKDLAHPDLINSGKVKLPIILDVISFEPPYHGESFTAINIEVSGAKWAKSPSGEVVENPTMISVYDYMNAGALADNSTAARAILLNLYKGKNQIVITKLAKDPIANNPTHILRQVPPSDPELAAAYQKAKSALTEAIKKEQDFNHLLEVSSIEKFKKLAAAPALEVIEDAKDDDDEEIAA